MKKLAAIICLIVLSVQVVPVKQIGSLLGSNTVNEELPHNFSSERTPDLKYDNTGLELSLHHFATETKSSAYIHFATSIPDNHNGEIHTPPPNMI